MKRLIFLTFLTLSSAVWVSAQSVDTDYSYASFEISNFGVNTVEGSFTGINGIVDFENNYP